MISGSYGGQRRHTTEAGRWTTPRVWHKLPTGELKNREVGRKVPRYIPCLCGNTFNEGKETSHKGTR